MARIFLRQLHDNLRSLRFQLGLVVLLLFFAANGFIYSWKMTQQVDEDARIQADVERIFEGTTTVAEAVDQRFKVLSEPLGTEFISEAGYNWFHDALWVTVGWSEGGRGSVRLESLRSTNNWMRRFELLDWTVIARYVLSFLCVVLAYNAVSGEVESGTLRLVLSNPVSRSTFLFGKLLAHLATVQVGTAVGSLVSLLILSLHGVLDLDLHIARSYLLFLVGTTVYAALFLLLGTAISALTRSSASSLVLLVTAWTVLIVVVPQMSYMLAARTVRPAGHLSSQLGEYERQVQQALIREGLLPRPAQLARVDDYALEKRFAQRLDEVVKEGDQIIRAAHRRNRVQYDLARSINLISPGYAFQYAVEALLGAGVERFERFHQQGWQYREDLRAFVRERDAADEESPHIPFLSSFMSTQELSEADIPRFVQPRLSTAESVVAGTTPILILILEAGLAFMLALWVFQRAEVAD